MKVYALWYGGSNYSSPTLEEDLEVFSSIKEARDELKRREHNSYYPCVADAEMHLFFEDPRDSFDAMPDRVIT
jgi:hypothetical protein